MFDRGLALPFDRTELGAIARDTPRAVRRFARRQPVGFAAGLIILVFFLVAILGEFVTTHDPLRIGAGPRLTGPSFDHFFGTDEQSRDVFSRVVVGVRLSARVGGLSVLWGVGGGALIGLISGYAGGRLDQVIQRVMDALLSLPPLLLALVFAASLGPGATTVIIALGIGFLPGANRVVRSAALAVKEEQFVEAARALGASNTRIVFRHILPNVVAPMIVLTSIAIGFAIVAEAALSFIGVGVQPPTISLGQLLADGRPFLETGTWIVLAPGVAITLVVLAFNFFGDALRESFGSATAHAAVAGAALTRRGTVPQPPGRPPAARASAGGRRWGS